MSTINRGTPINPDPLLRDLDERLARPEWVATIEDARNASGPGLVALCRLLDDDGTPPALREIARRFVEAKLYRADRPRARTGDPSTSEAAARRALAGITRPGGKVHRILTAYRDVADLPTGRDNYPGGATAREIEFVANVKAAHKRVSELTADGLLRVVEIGEVNDASLRPDADLVRNGGRVVRITKDGREELARLDAAQRRRDEADRAKAERRRQREQRREARQKSSGGVRSTP